MKYSTAVFALALTFAPYAAAQSTESFPTIIPTLEPPSRSISFPLSIISTPSLPLPSLPLSSGSFSSVTAPGSSSSSLSTSPSGSSVSFSPSVSGSANSVTGSAPAPSTPVPSNAARPASVAGQGLALGSVLLAAAALI